MQRQVLSEITFDQGFNNSRSPLDPSLAGTSAEGSCNNLLIGDSLSVPFAGFESKGANTGSRVMFNVGKNYGGIKDIGASLGSGSLFEDVGRSLWFIGNGAVSVGGATLSGLIASSSLRVSIASSGAYSGATTFDAGMPQPSAPDIAIRTAPGSGYTGLIDGAISVKLARLRLSTGGRSRASTTSAVVVPAKKTIRVTFPSASTGQDNWAIFFTQQGFGGVGLHYRGAYNGSLDIPESVVAAGTVDGIARSLEFDFQDGDLISELSYIDDYPPPAGTHAVRLENVMNVLGCYADTVSSANASNPGTCIAVSLPNFYESYKPRHLLFLPEQVVSVLSRPSDSYAWVACRNSIMTLQYAGLSDGPACTIATAFANVGIAYPHNWTQFYGRLCLFTSKGNLVIVTEEGNLDETFASPVKKFIRNWLPAETIVGFDVETNSIVIGNKDVTLAYCLDNGKWSDPCYLKDATISGNVLSCVTDNGNLLVSVEGGTNAIAFKYNKSIAAIPIVKVSPYLSAPSAASVKNIYELSVALSGSNQDKLTALVIQRNLRPITARNLSLTLGGNTLTSPTALFDAASVGDLVFVFNPGVFLAQAARISAVNSGTSAVLTNLDGTAFNALETTTIAFCMFGKFLKQFYPTAQGTQHIANFYPSVRDARSYAVAVWMNADVNAGAIHSITALGTQTSTSGARTN